MAESGRPSVVRCVRAGARHAAGAPSTSSSPPSSASPSASSSGPGACCGTATGAAFAAFPPGAGGHVRRLADARRAGAADRPQAGRGAVRRAARRHRLGAARLAVGDARSSSTACCRAWPARSGFAVVPLPPLRLAAGAAVRRCSPGPWPPSLDLVYCTPTGPAAGRSTYVAPRRRQHRGRRRRRRAGAGAGAGRAPARCARSPPAAPGSDHGTARHLGRPARTGRRSGSTGWGVPARLPARLGADRDVDLRRRARRAGAAHRRLRARASPRCSPRSAGMLGRRRAPRSPAS